MIVDPAHPCAAGRGRTSRLTEAVPGGNVRTIDSRKRSGRLDYPDPRWRHAPPPLLLAVSLARESRAPASVANACGNSLPDSAARGSGRTPALREKRHAAREDQHRAAGAVQLVTHVTADHDVPGRCVRLRPDDDQVDRLAT
jgi:hypothetical protein